MPTDKRRFFQKILSLVMFILIAIGANVYRYLLCASHFNESFLYITSFDALLKCCTIAVPAIFSSSKYACLSSLELLLVLYLEPTFPYCFPNLYSPFFIGSLFGLLGVLAKSS